MATVLLVEDDPAARQGLELALRRLGYEVHLAETGEAALDGTGGATADVVVLDVMLPGVDGFEVCRRLRRDSDVPVIMLTARGDDFDIVGGLEAGAGDYVVKPVEPRVLVGAIGVANIMVISVLERRSEIGLRRALGATKGHIRVQFLAEAILLSLTGGIAGIAAGAAAVAVYAHAKGWATVIPPLAWAGGLAAAILIGAAAGLVPALRAARLSPTQALWSL
jgi:CheY-like chemotaxis protein